jgi:excisionase family DNA binding protein
MNPLLLPILAGRYDLGMNRNRQVQRRRAHDTLSRADGGFAAGQALLFDNKTDRALPRLLTIPEVAELLHISQVGVRRLQQRRLIPFMKVGGSVRFAVNDVLSYLERQRVHAIG